MSHHSHRFRLGDHYCAWCGKSAARAEDRCDYNLIATDPNWKPSNYLPTQKWVEAVTPPLTKREVTLERKRLKESLRRAINKTVSKLKALERHGECDGRT